MNEKQEDDMNDRDTHFAGFARLVIDEVYANGPQTIQTYEQIIAQRAYDLARHIIWETMGGTPNAISIILADVPDLTVWPEG